MSAGLVVRFDCQYNTESNALIHNVLMSCLIGLVSNSIPTVPTAKGSGLSTDQVTRLFETYGLPAVKAIALLVIGYLIAGWVTKLVANACKRAKLDETLAKFLANFSRWIVLTAVVITCLSSFGVQVTSLVAILGSVGIAIGLALQGSLSHIASGVMLLIFRPFKVGDFVTAGGQTGIVDEISLFSTFLTTPDNRNIIVPNGAIVGGVIINSTANAERMVEVPISTNPAAGVEAARALLLKTANNVAGKLPEKAPGCTLTSMSASNTFNVTLWCKTPDVDAVKERLLIACNAAIAEANFAPSAPVALVKNV